VAIGSLAALSMAGMLVAIKLASNASKVQENVLKKELQSRTLSAGTSTHGFLYVPVPKNAPREKIRLHVPITSASAGETMAMDLIF